MKKTLFTLSLLALALSCSLASAKKEETNSLQQGDGSQVQQVDVTVADETLKSLRKNPITGPEDPPVDVDWKTKDTKVPRTFIHQPPVIPHNIEGFEIDPKFNDNDCLNCHGVEGSGAPKPFKTHYMDRDGKVTETIAARWFNCTQCHAGQADVPPLVENVFGSKGRYSLGKKEQE
ncbi:MAG: periplasmic nitrate reductase subunit NapB [Candidatus Electronema aureum]|uniref:Periplasmic nitrate reductase, electron transfer subunit n=1 Tax=Candidatus Electronema aureum TaxID=2005002 RepID=A0A521G377_9BACT|nr:MAG: periplasmic nitrate reductase subunit NapB [Candidatus Electronema aureum]